MVKVNFYLYDNKSNVSAIKISLFYKKRKQISLGQSIPIKYWNQKKQRPKPSYKLYSPLSRSINDIVAKVEKYNNVFGDNPNLDDCANFIKSAETKNTNKNIIDNFQSWAEKKSQDKIVSHPTYQTYISAKNHLQNYLKENNISDLKIDKINDNLFNSYHIYLNNKNISNRSASKYISKFKQFVKESYKLNVDYTVKFKKYPKLVLNNDELEIIKNAKFNKSYLENAKMLFMIQVYSALRISDIQQLFKNVVVDFVEKKLRVPIKKTGTYINIPFLSNIAYYLNELKIGNIRLISSQKYNNFLKEICKELNLNRKWQSIKEIGNERIVETKPIYDLISSHTARRTFVTISYKAGLLPEEIIQITGHSSTKEIKPYLNLVEDEIHNKAKDVWKSF